MFWYFLQCLQSCPEGKFGANCSYNCTCMNGATCDPVNGTCTCTQGWKGRNCSTRACSDGLFGPQCSSVCQCNVDNTDMWVLACCSVVVRMCLKAQWVEAVSVIKTTGCLQKVILTYVSCVSHSCDMCLIDHPHNNPYSNLHVPQCSLCFKKLTVLGTVMLVPADARLNWGHEVKLHTFCT